MAPSFVAMAPCRCQWTNDGSEGPRFGRFRMSAIAWILVFLSLLGPRFSLAEESSGLQTLKAISECSRANRERIRTWTGRAKITKWWYHTDKSSPSKLEGYQDIVKQCQEIEVEFAYDLVAGNLRSNHRLVKNVNFHADGRESSFLEADYHTMIKDGVYHRFLAFPHDRVGVMAKKDERSKAEIRKGRTMQRALEIYASAPEDLRDDRTHFNPVDRMYPSYLNRKVMEGRYAYLKKTGESDTGGIGVEQEGDVVTLRVGVEGSFDRYTIDMSKGATLVHLEKIREGKLAEDWDLQPQLVSGVWIPRSTRLWDAGFFTGRVLVTETEWLDSVINKPVDASEFSLMKMDLCRGDKIIDQRSGNAISRVSGAEFPPPPLE
ncbi:MAG: hypothetical protein JW809_19680 [Pirellulales bacterium]|nr:hypothetical protein [Pirellulales bacterium]